MTAAKAKAGKQVKLRQIKSGIGFSERQKATLKALGLGKLNRVRSLPDNPEVRGMIRKVPHLVTIVEES